MKALRLATVVFLLCMLSFVVNYHVAFAQVFSVDPLNKKPSHSSTPTLTFLWESINAKAVLIYIPGGFGRVGLRVGQKSLGGFAGDVLSPLSDSHLTSGLFHVVAFDSPTPLDTRQTYPISRATADHLMRMESVILFYKAKFGLPIWLIGHSNGAASITELYKHFQKQGKNDLISGLIYSSGRNGASFGRDTDVPVLFLAHKKDSCIYTTNANSLSVYSKLKRTNKSKTEYVFITGGEPQVADPCWSGHHMFNGASEEAYKAIDAFASQFY